MAYHEPFDKYGDISHGEKQEYDEASGIIIRLGDDCLDFYTLGYVLSDLYQLWVFSALVHDNDKSSIRKHFGKDIRYFNRYISLLQRYRYEPRIVDIHKGSIVIYLMGASIVTSVIMGIIPVLLSRELMKRGKSVTFNVDSTDTRLAEILKAYEQKVFGRGDPGLKILLEYLNIKGYSVEAIAENVYDVEFVTKRYSLRIARTLKIR